MSANSDLSSGLPELDQLLRGFQSGDNIVWQVERIEDYPRVLRGFNTWHLGIFKNEPRCSRRALSSYSHPPANLRALGALGVE